MRFFLAFKSWHVWAAGGFIAALAIVYVISELRENSDLRDDLKASERAHEVTVKALQDRDQRLEIEHRKTKDFQKVIYDNAYENRALSPLFRAYIDSPQ